MHEKDDRGRSNVREYPWREPGRSLYEVFVAEFFLTQTPADNVASVYPDFMGRFPSLKAIEESSEDELVDAIRPLGFQNMRASALKETASRVERIPEDPEELVKLPRVGRYITNAIVCFALSQPLPVIDRNVERIYSRIFGDDWPGSESKQVEFASVLVPENKARLYNFSLLGFGQLSARVRPIVVAASSRTSANIIERWCNPFRNISR